MDDEEKRRHFLSLAKRAVPLGMPLAEAERQRLIPDDDGTMCFQVDGLGYVIKFADAEDYFVALAEKFDREMPGWRKRWSGMDGRAATLSELASRSKRVRRLGNEPT